MSGSESFDALLREIARAPAIPLTKRSTRGMLAQRFDQYEIGPKLGSGGMGLVYLATDTRLLRKVAIKVLPSSRSSDAVWRQRFLSEAQRAARLDHSNIARIFELGEWDDELYIVMEFVDGLSLSDHLDQSRPTLAMVHRWSLELSHALAHAHATGVTHRDIKPDNVMIDTRGRIKVLDFGVAGETKSPARSFGGTGPYMAPEQAAGHAADARADVYAFGVVLAEMLGATRQRGPLRGQLQEIAEKCRKQERSKRFKHGGAVFSALRSCASQRSARP